MLIRRWPRLRGVAGFLGLGIAGVVLLAVTFAAPPAVVAALARVERPPWVTAAAAGALLTVAGFVGALVLARTADLGAAAAVGLGAGLAVAAGSGALGRR